MKVITGIKICDENRHSKIEEKYNKLSGKYKQCLLRIKHVIESNVNLHFIKASKTMPHVE